VNFLFGMSESGTCRDGQFVHTLFLFESSLFVLNGDIAIVQVSHTLGTTFQPSLCWVRADPAYGLGEGVALLSAKG
jgi:hypothetical protein